MNLIDNLLIAVIATVFIIALNKTIKFMKAGKCCGCCKECLGCKDFSCKRP